MKRKSARQGDVVMIEFLDHVEGDGPGHVPIPCKVYGEVVENKKDYYSIGSWVTNDDHNDINLKMFCILKSAITGMRILCEKRKK